ncbi:MAG: GIY-YIG nuclease family protein [Pyrinomonadaceae bacterium]|nr:GIY-YIG nuclease family protein [Pyrinomonadaceae bacterium]
MEREFEIYSQHRKANRVLLVGPRGAIIRKVDYSIYVLEDPRDNSVRYVGQTNNLKKRLGGHLCDKQDYSFVTTRSEWIFGLKKIGLRPQMKVVEMLFAPVDRAMINERESRWISHFYQQGENLTNVHCIRMPRLYKAIRDSRINFLTEPLDSAIWTELFELQEIDRKEWAEINHNLRAKN